MARKGRQSFSKYINGNISENFNLGTLAGRTVLSKAVTDAVVDSTRCSSIKCTYAIQNMTPGATIGPIMIGVAHSDYSDSEIEAAIEAASSWDVGDRISKEVRGRLVRRIGIFDSGDSIQKAARLNDGKPIRTKLNWLLSEGDTLKFWAYNLGTSALATTDPRVFVEGHANLWQL